MNNKCFSPKDVNLYYKNQQSHLASTGNWIDDLFPPEYKSLMAINHNGEFIDPCVDQKHINQLDANNLEWKKASELFPSGFYVFNKIEFDDIKQGGLANCYFLSAIAAMVEFPSLIKNIFRTVEYNPNGFYEVIMFVDGVWQIVVIDDYFPITKGTNNLAFTQTNGNEIWVIILEKAWAKINGGYLNILYGFSTDAFSTLTGFPCELINHTNFTTDQLWEKILYSDQSNDLMCGGTNSGDGLSLNNSTGLVEGHAYSVISARSAIHNGSKIRLLKLRNPWGRSEWTGDWSDESTLWDDELKAKFEYIKSDDGVFWISVEDYGKYFSNTYFCHVLNEEKVKNFYLSENDISNPNVYNMYLKHSSQVTFSVLKKHWRFNRELKNKNHPISIIVSRYDIESKKLFQVNGNFSSVNSCEFNATLESGHYLIWMYYAREASDSQYLNNLILRIASKSEFCVVSKGYDNGFNLLKEIIIAGVREMNIKEISGQEVYSKIDNSFLNTGIGYLFVSNSSTWKLNVTSDASNLSNMILLNSSDNLSVGINPGGILIIVGIKKSELTYWFNIQYKYEYVQKDGNGSNFIIDVTEYLSDLSNSYPNFDFITYVSEKPSSENYSQTNNDVVTNGLRRDFPDLMEKILELPKFFNDDELSWRHVNYDQNYYVGQYNKKGVIEGRGAYVMNGDGMFISQWTDTKKNGFGRRIDNNGNLVYAGNYQNDYMDGFGKYYYSNGDRYEGMFKDNNFSGKGIYYYASGEFWDGYFNQGRWHGKGYYSDSNGNKRLIEYNNNNLVS